MEPKIKSKPTKQTALRVEADPDDDSTYMVHCPSGNAYAVRYCGSGDGDPEYIALWECSCPSTTYRGTCKHINAVSQHCEDER